MKGKFAFWTMATFGLLIGLYPIIYSLGQIGILTSKPAEMVADQLWLAAFYAHIFPGGITLLIGWLQFHKKLRSRKLSLHRTIGKVYVLLAIISSCSGIYLGVYAEGGPISQVGFVLLGLAWLITTGQGWRVITKGKVASHQRWMTYSYAVCFAAVTLRLWMPVLILIFQNPAVAFQIVAWWSWIPNLLFAYWLLQRKGVSHPVASERS